MKSSNPKDIVGSTKLPMDTVPDTIEVEASLALLEGQLKYGYYNYRAVGVRASIYRAALRRHLLAWWNGEDHDPYTRVKHLGSVIACAGIILDAELMGKLTDDRPPANPDLIARMREASEDVKHLQKLFANVNPRHYTIKDSGDSPEKFSDVQAAVDAAKCTGKEYSKVLDKVKSTNASIAGLPSVMPATDSSLTSTPSSPFCREGEL